MRRERAHGASCTGEIARDRAEIGASSYGELAQRRLRGDGRLALGEKDAAPLVHETPFSPLCELTCALRLPLAESEQLVVMPATWGAAQCGPFELAAYGDRPFELVEI